MNSDTPMTLEEILDTIMFEEAEPNYGALQKWVARYPEHKAELAEFFAVWAEQAATSDKARIGERRVTSRLLRHSLDLTVRHIDVRGWAEKGINARVRKAAPEHQGLGATAATHGVSNFILEGQTIQQVQNVSRRGMLAAVAASLGPILVRHETEIPETESKCGLEKGLCGIIDGGAARACSMALKDVEPHYHKRTTELYYVLDGQGVVSLNGEEHLVRKGSFLHIPPGVVHSFTGEAKMLIIGVPAISTEEDMFYPSQSGCETTQDD